MEVIIFIVVVSLLFPSSGGGHFDGAGLVAGLLAGIIGLALIGAFLCGSGWVICQTWYLLLGEPIPGSGAATAFLFVVGVGSILSLFALCQIGHYFDCKHRARKAVRDQL
jgi:hypothetical protein